MIDFPANPTTGQQFTAAGVVWVFDGAKWTASGLNVAYLPLAGGTLLGPLVLAADPTVPLGAVTKEYVDGLSTNSNRIINGDMRIDQRNNGASGTASANFTVDRWQYSNNTGAVRGAWGRGGGGGATGILLTGFSYYLNFTTNAAAYTSAATDVISFYQPIEADMVTDFGWGQSFAQPVTLSFWFAATSAGLYSGSIRNYAGTRSYVFTFNFTTVGAYQKFIITIPGDTIGTWVMQGNVGSVILGFDLGVGVNYRAAAGTWMTGNFVGATGAALPVATANLGWQLTGVKLEVGSVATPFNRQTMAKSLADCQRYYQTFPYLYTSYYSAAATANGSSIVYPVPMRAAPTASAPGVTYSNCSALNLSANINAASIVPSVSVTAAGVFSWNALANGLQFSAEL